VRLQNKAKAKFGRVVVAATTPKKMNFFQHLTQSPIIRIAQAMHAHSRYVIYTPLQLCVMTHQRLCCTHLFLDSPQGEQFPLFLLGLALLLELVKPMG